MDVQFEIMTGLLTYRDIEFSFVFDENELRLIPPKDEARVIELEWLMTPIGKGVYTYGKPLQMEKSVLIGRCNENGRKIIFLPQEGTRIGSRNSVLFIEIVAYIVCKIDRDMIDRISFSSPELNFIHPVNKAFNFTLNMNTYSDKGVIELSTNDFASTTTDRQEFYVDDKKIYVHFGVSRRISTKIDEAPINLNSSLIFEFDANDDYQFILRLYRIAKSFIQYVCYRKNIQLLKAELSAPYENGKHENFATLYIIEETTIDEPETLKNGRLIKQEHVSGAEGKILSDIASGLIYTRHIPKSYEASRQIDAASFIMITSAFEWEFRRIYPNGVKRSEARANVFITW